jgi:hypothetical protein
MEPMGTASRPLGMTITGALRPALAVALLLPLAACAERGAAGGPGAGPSDPTEQAAASELVLRVEYVGGFMTPETQAGRLPLVSAYTDGRVILEGPMAAIHPPFAWPNVQVLDVGPERIQELADRALAAGVAETGDLGMPPLADVPSTRFTLVTADGTHVRDVYGLTQTTGMPDTGLTDAQEAARQALLGLFTELTDLSVAEASQDVPESWTPAAGAAVVRPWTASEEDIAQGMTPPKMPWPGPALPGEQLGPLPDLGCVVATGDQATAVIAAAGDANALTPWVSPDGTRWSVVFRPLLPDESVCADLLD